ncbi:hypothetical protein FO519_009881 [Halicephalobus sp. NKZ332]|nr:hypothetical protein FO519_009881 [Halicephalobus sp. NKZ332]
MEYGTRDSPNIKSIILEIHVASSILCLSDVHERNCGSYNGKASIFDFCVPEGEYEMNLNHFQTRKPQCVDTMVNVRSVGKMSAFAQTIDATERMKFGQNIVQQWNISERVDVAVNEVTSIKERIRAKGGIIEDTNDFNNEKAYIGNLSKGLCVEAVRNLLRNLAEIHALSLKSADWTTMVAEFSHFFYKL